MPDERMPQLYVHVVYTRTARVCLTVMLVTVRLRASLYKRRAVSASVPDPAFRSPTSVPGGIPMAPSTSVAALAAAAPVLIGPAT